MKNGLYFFRKPFFVGYTTLRHLNLVFIFNFVVAENVEASVRVEHLKLTLRYLRSLKIIRPKEIKSKLQSLMAANQVRDVLER